jgi:hypothetical protein
MDPTISRSWSRLQTRASFLWQVFMWQVLFARLYQDILYTLDKRISFSKIEAKNIPAVTPIWIDGGHVEVSHSLINA